MLGYRSPLSSAPTPISRYAFSSSVPCRNNELRSPMLQFPFSTFSEKKTMLKCREPSVFLRIRIIDKYVLRDLRIFSSNCNRGVHFATGCAHIGRDLNIGPHAICLSIRAKHSSGFHPDYTLLHTFQLLWFQVFLSRQFWFRWQERNGLENSPEQHSWNWFHRTIQSTSTTQPHLLATSLKGFLLKYSTRKAHLRVEIGERTTLETWLDYTARHSREGQKRNDMRVTACLQT